MTGPRSLLEELLEEKESGIRRAVDELWPEGAYLEFKRAARGKPPLQDADRNNLARALSGFSNADGGLVVWGVKSKEGAKNQPTVAQELWPIASVDRFVRDLEREVALVTTPLVAGVEHHVIKCDDDDDAGYVITLVPKGQGEPVMVNRKFSYYFRCGDQFMPMPHGMVADRFHRRPQPKIDLAVRLVPGGVGSSSTRGRHATVQVVLGIRNSGRGIALYPMLQVAPQCERGREFDWSRGATGLSERSHDLPADPFPWKVFAAGGGEPVHAGTVKEVVRIRLSIPENSTPAPITIRYSVHCDGDSADGSRTISIEEMRECRDVAFQA